MPEPDIADMEGFLAHIELVLPVLGFDFLKPRPNLRQNGNTDAFKSSPIFEFISGEASAKAQEIDGEFVVLKGSTALATPKDSWDKLSRPPRSTHRRSETRRHSRS